jgi:hypothetical protein
VTAAASASAGLRLEGAALERDLRLAREGWRRRFVGGPPRLTELVELYASLGKEVHLEPLDDDDLADTCAGCRVALSLFRIVYTR